MIPDLENTSYTRIANYLERQARQRGYQLLIACSEDQPDNEMRCIEEYGDDNSDYYDEDDDSDDRYYD